MGLFFTSRASAANSPDDALDPVMETLAPRILYSADAAAIVAPLTAEPAVEAVVEAAWHQAVEQPDHNEQTVQASALVVVDDSIDDVDVLLTFLAAEQRRGVDVDWLVISQQTDGIEAVADALSASDEPYDAIHVFSHGTDATLTLGTSVVDQETLAAHADSFSAWGSGLSSDADILLYACDFSTNEQGKALADNLATMTGADIATSNNTSGHTDLGGDWVLEEKTGAIEAPVLVTPELSTNWISTLAITPSSSEFSVPQDTSQNDQLQNDVGGRQVASNGTMTVVAWERNNDIVFRRFQIDGTPIDGTDQVIENNLGHNRSQPSVAIASNGDFAIVWVQTSDGHGIRAQFFNADGSSKSRPADAYTGTYSNPFEFRVNNTSPGNQTLPAIAARADDSFLISWSGPIEFLGNTTETVLFAIHDIDGGRVESETVASFGLSGDEIKPSIATHPTNDTSIIAYEFEEAEDRIQLRRVAANGSINLSAVNLEEAGTTLTNPSIAIADNGIAYVTAIADEDDVLMWIVATDNTLITPAPLQVNAVTGGRLINAEVAVEGNNTVLVVWETDQGPDQDEVAIRQYDGNGNPVTSESYVNLETDGHQHRPSLALTGNTALVVWSGDSATDNDGVFMRQLTVTTPGVLVTAGGNTTNELGSTVTLAIRLETQPTENVFLTLSSSDTSEGVPAVAAMTFSPTDWNSIKLVNISGVDDTDADGDIAYNITVAATSADPVYNSLPDTIIELTNIDNESNPVGAVSDIDPTTNEVSENSAAGAPVGIRAFADDADVGDSVEYSLAGASAGFFNIGLTSGIVTTSATPLDYENSPSHTLTVIATSSDLSTSQQDFTIAVLNQNDNAPVITPAQAFSIDENSANNTVVGTPSASDADGTSSFEAWSITGGSGASIFNINAASGQITVADQTALDFESTPSLTLTLTTSDGLNTSAPQTVTINLNDINEAPMGADATSTGIEDNDLVLLSAEFVLNDPDAGNTLQGIEVRTLPGAGDLLLNGTALNGSTTLPLFVTSAALDNGDLVYRPPANNNGAGLTSFGVGVVDQSGASSVTRQQTININAVDDPPVINSYGGAATVAIDVAENTSVVGGVTAADAENEPMQYTGAGPDAGLFSVDLNTGALQFIAAPDFEIPQDSNSDNQYEITVQAADPAGNADSQTFTVTITNVNEAPLGADATSLGVEDIDLLLTSTAFVLNDPDAGDSLQGIEVRSLPSTGTLIFNGTALNGSTSLPLFVSTIAVDNDELIYRPPANANGLNLTSFDIAVVDQAGVRSPTRQQTIDITAVDDPPVITSYGGAATVTIDVAENSLVVGAVTASDAESELMQYAGSGADAALFDVDTNTGAIRFLSAPDFENPQDSNGDNQYELTVRATDPANNADTQALNINVTNESDGAPIIASGQVFPLSESAMNGSAVATPAATNPDGSGSFEDWTITGGTGSSAFSIDASTGLISVSDATTLDFESASTLTLLIAVSDGVNTSAPETVTIELSDANEAPQSADGLSTGIEDTDYAFALGDFAFIDPDAGDSLSAIVLTSVPDEGELVLNGVGLNGSTSLPVTVLRADLLAGTFVYRPAPDTSGSAITSFTFAAVDASGVQSAQATQTLGAVPVNDAPVIGGSRQATISIGNSLTLSSSLLTATDLEDDANSVVYTVVTDPSQGILLIDGEAIAQGDRFTQADIDAGRIRYQSQATTETVDSIGLRASDSEGAVVGDITVSISTVASSITTPPPADQTIPPPSTENEATESSDDEGDGAADDESEEGVAVGVVSPSPVYNPTGSNSESNAASQLSDENDTSVQLASSRAQQDRFNAGGWLMSGHYGSDLARNELEILGLRSNFSQPEFDRLTSAMLTTDFERMRDVLGDDFARQLEFDRTVVASSVAFSASMSIGYVLWLLRSGALLSSVLASIPAWRSIDPLPILASVPNRDNSKNDQSLEQMVDGQETAADADADPKRETIASVGERSPNT